MSFLPKTRSDLEITPRVVEGEGLQYIVKDPQTEKIFAFGEEDYFILRQLDGETTLPDIQVAVFEKFHRSMDLEQLEALVRHLATLELVDYPLTPFEVPWHFPIYYKKFILGNPDRALFKIASFFSWCFNRTFAICLGVFVFICILVLAKNFSHYRWEVMYTLWNPGPFFLETFLGIFVVNLMGEFAKAVALKHYGGNISGACVGLAYRLIPTFHFDLSDLWVKKKSKQLVIFSSGLAVQVMIWGITVLGWKLTTPWTMIHKFWLIFSVAGQFFFLINLIPLLPRDGYYLLSTWLDTPDLWYRSRGLVEAWFYRHPLPEPVIPKERFWLKVFGILSITFLFTFWLLVLAILGYLLIWHWKLKGLGACIFLIILGLRYGDAMKQIFKILFFPRKGVLADQRGFFKTRYLFKIIIVVVVILVFFIPYPFEAGGDFKLLPVHQLSIRAVVPGEITQILVHENQWVEKGQPLAILLDKDFRARVDSTKEALTANQEKLAWMIKGPRPQDVARAEQEVALAAKALHYSKVEANRYTKMFKEKAVTEQDYMNALKRRDEDRERLILARKNLDVVKNPYRPEEIKAQGAEVRRLEAELALAEKNLKLTTILSPAAGRLITAYPLQKVGEYLHIGELMGVIQDGRKFIAEIEVPQEDIELVKVGAKVKLKTWAYPTHIFHGKVTAIAPTGIDLNRKRVMRNLTENEFRTMQVVPEEGKVIRVMSEFPNARGLLRTDMTGYAKIEGKWMPLGVAFTRWLVRFVMVEVWSWIP